MHPGFIVELNRPMAYRRALVRRLERLGFFVDEIGHKTTLVIRYDTARKFRQLRAALLRVLDSQIGGLVLFSKKTAKAWKVSNRGNRAGIFVRI